MKTSPLTASFIRKAAGASAVLGAAGFLSLYLPYRIAFRSPQKGQNDIYRLPPGEQYEPRAEEMRGMIRQMAAEPCERVSIMSRDGLKLRGRLYLRGGPEAPVDLCFHGWRATGLRDFSGGGLFLLGEGHNVLLADQRAQGDSEGRTMTFGVMERWDCLDWLAYIRTRPELRGPVTLYGVSMGAATVLLASALPLPGNVRCIIADSPYSSPEAVLGKVSRDMGLPERPALALLRGGAALFGGFSFHGELHGGGEAHPCAHPPDPRGGGSFRTPGDEPGYRCGEPGAGPARDLSRGGPRIVLSDGYGAVSARGLRILPPGAKNRFSYLTNTWTCAKVSHNFIIKRNDGKEYALLRHSEKRRPVRASMPTEPKPSPSGRT